MSVSGEISATPAGLDKPAAGIEGGHEGEVATGGIAGDDVRPHLTVGRHAPIGSAEELHQVCDEDEVDVEDEPDSDVLADAAHGAGSDQRADAAQVRSPEMIEGEFIVTTPSDVPVETQEQLRKVQGRGHPHRHPEQRRVAGLGCDDGRCGCSVTATGMSASSAATRRWSRDARLA